MNKITFFAKPPFEIKHLMRVSSIIRGEQIAAYMQNARLNPPEGSGYEDDVCVYVKPMIRPGQDYKFEKHSWVDIHDGFELRHTLRKYPDVGCISISDHATYVLKQYIKNRIVTIPHHHCNFERAKREGDTIVSVGITGSPQAFEFIPQELRKGLADRGMKLVEWSHFYPRTSVAKFHQKIDIHLEWRPWRKVLSSPLKITNAASFGVPTIALTSMEGIKDLEPSFPEVEGCYIGVGSVEEWFAQLDTLRTSDGKVTPKYKEMSEFCVEKMEKYHIDNISKLYEQLD